MRTPPAIPLDEHGNSAQGAEEQAALQGLRAGDGSRAGGARGSRAGLAAGLAGGISGGGGGLGGGVNDARAGGVGVGRVAHGEEGGGGRDRDGLACGGIVHGGDDARGGGDLGQGDALCERGGHDGG